MKKIEGLISAFMDDPLGIDDAVGISEKIQNDADGLLAITQDAINRAEFVNPKLNAIAVEDFDGATAKLRQSQRWTDAYMSIGNSKATVPVDSFVAEVMEGFDDVPSLSEGVIMVNMWKPNPGRLADLKTGVQIAKDMHMKHGASAICAYQIYGGRFTGCYGYNVSFTDMAAMGSWWDTGRQENEKYFEEAAKDPAAEVQAQMALDNPAVIGR